MGLGAESHRHVSRHRPRDIPPGGRRLAPSPGACSDAGASGTVAVHVLFWSFLTYVPAGTGTCVVPLLVPLAGTR